MKNHETQNAPGRMFITGATSGFGEAVARMAAKAGYALALTGRRAIDWRPCRLNWVTRCSTCCVLMCATEKERPKPIQRCSADFIPTVLVNNAGLAVGREPIDQGVYDDWDRMIDTNVKGLLNVTREWTPHMARGSRIINIGSVAGRQAYPGGAVYNASKFAVHGLTQAMRMDLLPRGIQVAQVAPGAAETEFSMVRFKGDEAAANAVYGGYTPLSAEDVADAVMYIATRPEHVSIQDVLIMPAAQASAYHFHKS